MLTRKQKDLLLLIRDRLAADSVPPSFDEMKEALGLRSKSGIHRLITGLEERGFIKRLPHRARALEILRLPEGAESKGAKGAKRGRMPLPTNLPDMAAISAIISLPLYGRIAAGTPIEAISHPHEHIEVPAGLLAGAKGKRAVDEHYVLEIDGDSMIEAGIMNGDRAIIRKADTAENGAIVVALVDDNEATLKRLERRDGSIALIPANARYETQIYTPGRVKVQGKLVGIVRKY
ncbi:MAG: transcriptional repressor LexA [Alphaproteobacteria bacterium]|nr:transcriptional repressor LexA [Alphaproteobacteria bacterium]